MNNRNNGWTDQQMGGHAIVMHGHAKNNGFSIEFLIITKADGPTNGRTNRRTNRRTAIPSYRDAIVAFKNGKVLTMIRKKNQ